MAKFRYQHIYSTVEDKAPDADFILDGEIAVNGFAGKEKLFIKNSEGDVVAIGGGGGGDLSNYYTKQQTNNLLDDKLDVTAYTPTDLSNYYTKDETSGKTELETEFAKKLEASDVANFFDDAEYDSSAKTINFYNGQTLKVQIDATAFIKDGMVDDVEIKDVSGTTVLAITFNGDAGKEEIDIPLTDIFDPSNYYTKQEVDARDLWVSGSSQNSALLKGSNGCTASGQCAISIGGGNNVTGNGSMAIGDGGNTINGSNSFAFGAGNNISGETGTTFGGGNRVVGNLGIAMGGANTVSGDNSTAIGVGNIVKSDASFAFGGGNISSGTTSIAMGSGTTSTGYYSFTEGVNTVATGWGAHAEGSGSTATGDWGAHAEGRETQAIGASSHAEGDTTIAQNDVEHASGQFNISSQETVGFGDSGNTLFSVGNGYGTGREHNAFEIRQNGDIYISDPSSDADFYEKPMVKLDFGDYVSEKQYNEDQVVIAAALNDLDNRKIGKGDLNEMEAIIAAALNDLDNRKIGKKELDEEEAIISASLNDLNTRFDGLRLKKISQSDYDDLVNAGTVDANTLYIII